MLRRLLNLVATILLLLSFTAIVFWVSPYCSSAPPGAPHSAFVGQSVARPHFSWSSGAVSTNASMWMASIARASSLPARATASDAS